MPNPNSNITVVHDSQVWSTDLTGDISEVKIDGRKLNDIHALTEKIEKMSMIIKILTFTAVIAVAGIGLIGSWIASNKDQIALTMKTAEERFSESMYRLRQENIIYAKKLKELGWRWDDQWKQVSVTNLSPES